MHSKVAQVTQAIIERSRASRGDYLQRIEAAKGSVVSRSNLSCGNLAHGFAACSQTDKDRLTMMDEANVAIVSDTMTCSQRTSLLNVILKLLNRR